MRNVRNYLVTAGTATALSLSACTNSGGQTSIEHRESIPTTPEESQVPDRVPDVAETPVTVEARSDLMICEPNTSGALDTSDSGLFYAIDDMNYVDEFLLEVGRSIFPTATKLAVSEAACILAAPDYSRIGMDELPLTGQEDDIRMVEFQVSDSDEGTLDSYECAVVGLYGSFEKGVDIRNEDLDVFSPVWTGKIVTAQAVDLLCVLPDNTGLVA